MTLEKFVLGVSRDIQIKTIEGEEPAKYTIRIYLVQKRWKRTRQFYLVSSCIFSLSSISFICAYIRTFDKTRTINVQW